MICSNCGGLVLWKGPFSALTHTECEQCGAVNSQIVEETEYTICPNCNGVCGVETAPNDWHDCDNCEATGKVPS